LSNFQSIQLTKGIRSRALLSLSLTLGLLLLLSLPGARSAFAQDHFAAKLTIAFEGVEVQRSGTTDWLPLPLGAETAFNVGDSLHTGDHGRAYLEFQTDGQVLILPRSTYQLIEFAYSPNLHLSAKMSGNLVQKLSGTVDAYRLETPRLTITQTSALLAVWDRDGSPASVTSADGTAQTTVGGKEFTVSNGQGLLLKDTPVVVNVPLPLTEPHLEGALDGCPGTIHTNHDQNINIHTGIDSDIIGNAPNDSVVRVMGTNHNQSWYRIQIFSGFGWIQADLVRSACSGLPVLPETSYEFNWGLQQIQPFEFALLEPFYGAPEHDPWYYVTFLAPEVANP